MNKCGHHSIKNKEELQTFKNGVRHLRVSCGECDKFVCYKQQPLNVNSVMGFGKYKDCKIKDIPRSYLEWIIESDWVKNNLKNAVKEYLDAH